MSANNGTVMNDCAFIMVGCSNVKRLSEFLSDFTMKNTFTRWVSGGHIPSISQTVCRMVNGVRNRNILVTLHIGGNDVAFTDRLDLVIHNYAELIRTIKEQAYVSGKKCLVSVCTLPPRYPVYMSTAEKHALARKINHVNSAIEQLCSSTNSLYTNIIETQKGSLGHDGVHYTTNGAKRVAGAIMSQWRCFLAHGRIPFGPS